MNITPKSLKAVLVKKSSSSRCFKQLIDRTGGELRGKTEVTLVARALFDCKPASDSHGIHNILAIAINE